MQKRALITKRGRPSSAHNPGSFEPSHALIIEQLKELCCSSSHGVALVCNPSLEGVVASVGLIYLAHVSTSELRLVRSDTYQGRLGEICIPSLDPAKESTVTLAQRVLTGFERQQNFVDDTTHALNTLARQVATECEHMRQFVRFSRMSDNSFMAVFKPHANVLPLASGYFVRRLGNERFFIVDPVHGIVAFHAPEMKNFGIMKPDKSNLDILISRKDLAADEPYVRALWKEFYRGVELPGRDASQRGYDLRAHWMPKRFWEGLTELSCQDLPRNAKVPLRYQGTSKKRLFDTQMNLSDQ